MAFICFSEAFSLKHMTQMAVTPYVSLEMLKQLGIDG